MNRSSPHFDPYTPSGYYPYPMPYYPGYPMNSYYYIVVLESDESFDSDQPDQSDAPNPIYPNNPNKPNNQGDTIVNNHQTPPSPNRPNKPNLPNRPNCPNKPNPPNRPKFPNTPGTLSNQNVQQNSPPNSKENSRNNQIKQHDNAIQNKKVANATTENQDQEIDPDNQWPLNTDNRRNIVIPVKTTSNGNSTPTKPVDQQNAKPPSPKPQLLKLTKTSQGFQSSVSQDGTIVYAINQFDASVVLSRSSANSTFSLGLSSREFSENKRKTENNSRILDSASIPPIPIIDVPNTQIETTINEDQKQKNKKKKKGNQNDEDTKEDNEDKEQKNEGKEQKNKNKKKDNQNKIIKNKMQKGDSKTQDNKGKKLNNVSDFELYNDYETDGIILFNPEGIDNPSPQPKPKRKNKKQTDADPLPNQSSSKKSKTPNNQNQQKKKNKNKNKKAPVNNQQQDSDVDEEQDDETNPTPLEYLMDNEDTGEILDPFEVEQFDPIDVLVNNTFVF